MAKINSKSSLAVILSRLEGFKEPKVRVEQYIMDSEIGAEVLWNGYLKGDIKGKVIADLGCGTGILGLGALILGVQKAFFVDIDTNALEITKNSYKRLKSEDLIDGEGLFFCMDIENFSEKCDVVVQNPPFGVKKRHADRVFLKKAFEIAPVVYSFHKSESKGFIEKFSSDNGFFVTGVFDFNFPLKASLKFHKRKIHRIKVSCFRLERKDF